MYMNPLCHESYPKQSYGHFANTNLLEMFVRAFFIFSFLFWAAAEGRGRRPRPREDEGSRGKTKVPAGRRKFSPSTRVSIFLQEFRSLCESFDLCIRVSIFV